MKGKDPSVRSAAQSVYAGVVQMPVLGGIGETDDDAYGISVAGGWAGSHERSQPRLGDFATRFVLSPSAISPPSGRAVLAHVRFV